MPLFILPTSSSGTSAIPQVVLAGITLTLATNTQTPISNSIVVQATGIILTVGTACITYIN